MLGLTNIGIIHTAISLIALGTGFYGLVRYQRISPSTKSGRVYVATTILTCLTGFAIFQHGGFGKPHVLGIITLLVLVVAAMARTPRFFGRAAAYVETVSYSATFLFHLIPAVTETTTRLPVGAPWIADRDGPELQTATAVMFVAFLIGATLQVRQLRAKCRREPMPTGRPQTNS